MEALEAYQRANGNPLQTEEALVYSLHCPNLDRTKLKPGEHLKDTANYNGETVLSPRRQDGHAEHFERAEQGLLDLLRARWYLKAIEYRTRL